MKWFSKINLSSILACGLLIILNINLNGWVGLTCIYIFLMISHFLLYIRNEYDLDIE